MVPYGHPPNSNRAARLLDSSLSLHLAAQVAEPHFRRSAHFFADFVRPHPGCPREIAT
jgi:hypothetical protein